MRRLDAGVSGRKQQPIFCSWDDLSLEPSWLACVQIIQPNSQPTLLQQQAFGVDNVLQHRQNVIISAPTNSGKSLVGLLPLLQAIQGGQRAVLLEPLRAIAQEKAEQLQQLSADSGRVLKRPFTVHLSTGDYRLEHETFSAAPSEKGELVIATPERLEAIFRNPEYAPWVNTIGAVCVDEAHLVTSKHRGPTLEYLLTSLLCLPTPPRLVLLSATLGDTHQAQDWLTPCAVIRLTERTPPLHKAVWLLESGEDANDMLAQEVKKILSAPEHTVLVFVYQTRSAEATAKILQTVLGDLAGEHGVLAYHARMNASQRKTVQTSFRGGECRCIVATTALGLGVNLPATHVIVRDTTFVGNGRLTIEELIQMMGRAGRGHRVGYASVILRANDSWSAPDLLEALRDEKFPDFVSSYAQQLQTHSWQSRSNQVIVEQIATHVAAHLARQPAEGYSLDALQQFFARSFSGMYLTNHIPLALNWLADPYRALAYQSEYSTYHLTVLGTHAVRAVLPLTFASRFAQFIRDLISIDTTGKYLALWQPLDHLVVLSLLYERQRILRPFSSQLMTQVDIWMEQNSQHVPLIYREWVSHPSKGSGIIELLGSLGFLPPVRTKNITKWAIKRIYLAIFHAILLFERSQGKPILDVSKRWRVTQFDGVEERWRDEYLWLLNGVKLLLEIRTFYYHLRESCQMNSEQIRQIKTHLRHMSHQTYALQEQLKYCSPLGDLLHSIRRTQTHVAGKQIGIQSIRKLEVAGITSTRQLVGVGIEELVQLGIRRDLAQQLYAYTRRRLQ